MAKAILVTAVNGTAKSEPFKVFRANEEVEIPKQFVLRLDAGTDREGNPVTKVNNGNLGLIASHNPEWIEGTVTGFRRKQDDSVYVICTRFKEEVPSISSLTKVEAY